MGNRNQSYMGSQEVFLFYFEVGDFKACFYFETSNREEKKNMKRGERRQGPEHSLNGYPLIGERIFSLQKASVDVSVYQFVALMGRFMTPSVNCICFLRKRGKLFSWLGSFEA